MAGFRYRYSENDERSGGATEVKQATAVGRDRLVVRDAEAEEVTEFVEASTETPGRADALETAHTSYAAFNAAMILFQSVVLVSAATMDDPPAER